MPQPSTRQPRSRALLSFLAVLFLILGSLIWITPGPARAADTGTTGDTSATANTSTAGDTSTASDTSPAADAASSPRAVVQCSQGAADCLLDIIA